MDRKNFMFKLTACCFFCVYLQSALAYQSAPSSARSVPVAGPSLVTNANGTRVDFKDAAEIALLRAQVKSSKEYQDTLLNIVCWSLSGTLAIALLLAGFGWWSNFKIYEADKKRLSDDFEARIIKLKSDLELKAMSFNSELEKIVDEKNAQYFERIQKETLVLRSEIPSVRSEFLERLALIEKPIQGLSKKTIDNEKSVYDLEATLRDVEENIWEMKGVWPNVLLTQGQRVRAAIRADNKYQVEGALEDMVETIEKMIKIGKSVDQNFVKLFTSAVKNASESNPIEVTKVLESFSKIKVENAPE